MYYSALHSQEPKLTKKLRSSFLIETILFQTVCIISTTPRNKPSQRSLKKSLIPFQTPSQSPLIRAVTVLIMFLIVLIAVSTTVLIVFHTISKIFLIEFQTMSQTDLRVFMAQIGRASCR